MVTWKRLVNIRLSYTQHNLGARLQTPTRFPRFLQLVLELEPRQTNPLLEEKDNAGSLLLGRRLRGKEYLPKWFRNAKSPESDHVRTSVALRVTQTLYLLSWLLEQGLVV